MNDLFKIDNEYYEFVSDSNSRDRKKRLLFGDKQYRLNVKLNQKINFALFISKYLLFFSKGSFFLSKSLLTLNFYLVKLLRTLTVRSAQALNACFA